MSSKFLLGGQIKKVDLIKLYSINYDYSEYFITRIQLNKLVPVNTVINLIDHTNHEIRILKYYYKNKIEDQTEEEFMQEELKHIKFNKLDETKDNGLVITEIDDDYFIGMLIDNFDQYEQLREQFFKNYTQIVEYFGEIDDLCIKKYN